MGFVRSTTVEYSQQVVFYRVLLPAARQTPNLEDQWLKHPPSGVPHAWNDASSGRWKHGGEKAENFADSGDFHFTFGFFYMPKIYNMGPTALLPLRRKACWGFFRPKNPKASAGIEPANLGTKGQHAYLYTTETIKPTRCTNFTNLFFYKNLHVSDSSSVHHQEFIHRTLSNGICHTSL